MKDWKDKFVIYFVIGLILVFVILVIKAMDKGTTSVEDVLEPTSVFSFE